MSALDLPPGARVTRYAFTVFETANDHEDLFVERRDRHADVWAIVTHTGFCWTRERIGFCYESQPSNRTREWLAESRWTLAEAMAEIPRAIEFRRRRDGRLARWFRECRENGIAIHVPDPAEVEAIIAAAKGAK